MERKEKQKQEILKIAKEAASKTGTRWDTVIYQDATIKKVSSSFVAEKPVWLYICGPAGVEEIFTHLWQAWQSDIVATDAGEDYIYPL